MNNNWENDPKGIYILSKVVSVNESCDFIMDGTIVENSNESQNIIEVDPGEKTNNYDYL
jgi:hypothetical protein